MSATSKALAALAPSPLSQYLARQKLAQRRQRRADGLRRRVTAARVQTVELILADIIAGADVLREVAIAHTWHEERGVALLVILSEFRLRQLCEIDAELEEGGEEEREGPEIPEGDDEPSLGSDAGMDQSHWISGPGDDGEGPNADNEPSLGSCDGITDQSRWAEGYFHGDNERDDADREPSLGSAQTMDQTAWASGGSRDLENPDDDDEDSGDREPSLCGVLGSGAEHARPDDQGRSDMEGGQ